MCNSLSNTLHGNILYIIGTSDLPFARITYHRICIYIWAWRAYNSGGFKFTLLESNFIKATVDFILSSYKSCMQKPKTKHLDICKWFIHTNQYFIQFTYQFSTNEASIDIVSLCFFTWSIWKIMKSNDW